MESILYKNRSVGVIEGPSARVMQVKNEVFIYIDLKFTFNITLCDITFLHKLPMIQVFHVLFFAYECKINISSGTLMQYITLKENNLPRYCTPYGFEKRNSTFRSQNVFCYNIY